MLIAATASLVGFAIESGSDHRDLGAIFALCYAAGCIAAVLLAGSLIQRGLGIRGISILSKLTGLILAALAAQMMMTGIQSFLGIVGGGA